MKMSDQEFEAIIAAELDNLPERYVAGLKNVAIVYEDDPTPEQRTKLRLRCNETLFGLFEGLPITKRPAADNVFLSNMTIQLPDKITIFKNPIINHGGSIEKIKEQVRHTLWHEIAHYYGLDHEQIHKLDNNHS